MSKRQYDRIMSYIEAGKSEGAALMTGGGRPKAEELQGGFFIAHGPSFRRGHEFAEVEFRNEKPFLKARKRAIKRRERGV